MCVTHSLGLDPKQNNGKTRDSERGNNLFRHESAKQHSVQRQLDFNVTETSEIVLEDALNNEQQSDQRSHIRTMTLEMNRVAFQNKTNSTLAVDVQNLSEKTKNLCYTYVKTKLSTKGKLHKYYATRLRGLQFNSTETSETDLAQHYVLPEHWYFKSRTNRDYNEQNNTN